jgi:hypothetical protein
MINISAATSLRLIFLYRFLKQYRTLKLIRLTPKMLGEFELLPLDGEMLAS